MTLPQQRPLLVFALALLFYLPTLRGDFLFDDESAVRDNPIVHRLDLGEIFATDYWAGFLDDRSGLYRPLAVLSFALHYRLAGAEPLTYHLANLLLHGLNALLLYGLARRLARSEDLALWTALLFAAHPAPSEAVCALVGRADLLAALGSLAALLLHLQGRCAMASLAFLAALLSKESAVALPALFLLVDLLQYRSFPRKSYSRAYLLHALALLAYLLVRARVLGGLGTGPIDPLDNPLAALDPSLRLLNATLVLFRYLGLLALPDRLTADYSHAALPLFHSAWPALLYALVGSAALAALLWLGRRRAPLVVAGLLWTLLALAPVANIALPIGAMMAERLLYLPAAGFCLGLAALVRHPLLPPLLPLVLLAFFAGRTLQRSVEWTDPYALFARAVEVRPESARAWRGLGRAALAREREAEALMAFRRALEIHPHYYEVHNDLGAMHFAHGQYPEALARFEKALQVRPDYPLSWHNLGLVLHRLQRPSQAARALEQALSLAPRYAGARYSLGVLYLEEGRLEEAALLFREVLSLDPEHERARFNLKAIDRALKEKHRP